jgi:hypothetical protein
VAAVAVFGCARISRPFRFRHRLDGRLPEARHSRHIAAGGPSVEGVSMPLIKVPSDIDVLRSTPTSKSSAPSRRRRRVAILGKASWAPVPRSPGHAYVHRAAPAGALRLRQDLAPVKESRQPVNRRRKSRHQLAIGLSVLSAFSFCLGIPQAFRRCHSSRVNCTCSGGTGCAAPEGRFHAANYLL